MSEQVTKNMWVTLQYRLFDSNQEALEEDDREMTYLHGGYGEVFSVIENALEGKRVDEKVSLYLQPEDTYGDYDASLLRMVPLERFPEGLEEGMIFESIPGETPDGRWYTVSDLADQQVIMDGNHPLAGMAIRYDLTVVDIVAASTEEIASELDNAGGGRSPLGNASSGGLMH